jgi:hypothetical protein
LKHGPSRVALDASATAVSAASGYGGGLGGVFGFRVSLPASLRLRAAFAFRAGDVAPAQATSRVLSLAGGVAWQPYVDHGRRWSMGARVDALLLHQELSHLSPDDPSPSKQSGFIPGLDAALEGAFWFAEQAAIIGAVGSEATFGRTAVLVRGREVAVLSPLRGFAELGLRVLF